MRPFFLPKILLLTIYLEAVSILFLFLFKQFFICDFQNFIWKFLQTWRRIHRFLIPIANRWHSQLLCHRNFRVKTIQCQDNLFIVILNIIRRTSNYFPVSETFILSGSIFSNFRNASDTRHGKVLNSSSTKANLFAWVETLNLYRSHSYGMKHPHSRKDLRISSWQM